MYSESLNIRNIFPYFFIGKVLNHTQIKDKILEEIENMGQYSFISEKNGIKISNTDWYLPSNEYRPYYDIVSPSLNDYCQRLCSYLKYDNIGIDNYWYQQYKFGDYHNWHNHPKGMFSNVYYLDLGEGTPKTTFKFMDDEFELEVEEGQIITFPSFLVHCSKINNSKNTKTVIAFNSSGQAGTYY
jgi:hypothetical protein